MSEPTDTELLNWLDDFLKTGCFESCFEMDGGLNALFSPCGGKEVVLRDQNDLRQVIRKGMERIPRE